MPSLPPHHPYHDFDFSSRLESEHRDRRNAQARALRARKKLEEQQKKKLKPGFKIINEQELTYPLVKKLAWNSLIDFHNYNITSNKSSTSKWGDVTAMVVPFYDPETNQTYQVSYPSIENNLSDRRGNHCMYYRQPASRHRGSVVGNILDLFIENVDPVPGINVES